jgi:hypothetical protein
LTDEASHELLLLYGCADAALEVAFMEHGDRLWYGIGLCCLCRSLITAAGGNGVVVFLDRH